MFRLCSVGLVLALLPGIVNAQTAATPMSATTGQIAPIALPPLYTDKERTEIVEFWNAPGRYTITIPADTQTEGPYRVRLSAEGSQWFWNYQRTVAGKSKLPPTQDARPTSGPYAEWEAWVNARVAYEKALAQAAADRINMAFVQNRPDTTATPRPLLASRAGKRQTTGDKSTDKAGRSDNAPTPPGPIPPGLLAACGNPPAFASIVTPMQYEVRFDDSEDSFIYTDNVKLRDRYAYYRFPRGVVSYGARLKDMPANERDELFRAAGFTPSEQRIFSAVSKLEGGFETVQTYDTGYVSVGFIQFVTLAEGKHDLSEVLLLYKDNRPREFKEDFRRFGIDVQPDKTLTVVDPSTGAELTGNAAVMKIIDDKRLTAVFQRAGRRPGFRIAQIKVARSFYWPTNDMLNATLSDGTVLSGKVGDCIKSEAGLACLLDRKINTGNIRLLNDVALRVAKAHNCKTIAELSTYEQEIIAAMKYRENFLADATLGQPALPKSTPVAVAVQPAAKTAVKPVTTLPTTEPAILTIPDTPVETTEATKSDPTRTEGQKGPKSSGKQKRR